MNKGSRRILLKKIIPFIIDKIIIITLDNDLLERGIVRQRVNLSN